MPKQQTALNDDLFKLLKIRGYEPNPYSTDGKAVPVPSEADVFQFHFLKNGKDYGPVTVSIDGANDLKVYYNSQVAQSPKDGEQEGDDGGISWYQLLKQLKLFAKNHQLGFDLEDQDNLKYDMAKREHTKKLDEGYYPMGKAASYSDAVPSVKMIIKHTRQIEEGEQRYRNVAKIFVENANGERFLLPTTKPGIGRVYARHVAEGGTPYDERGQHITSLVEEYTKMAGFVRATRGSQFNESAQRLVTEGLNHYAGLRETLHKMSGKKGYGAYFESWTPSLMEDEDQEDLSEMFMASSLDPRIESCMPILGKLSKKLGENKFREVDELSEWADSIVDETLLPSSQAEEDQLADILSGEEGLPVGPDASNAKNALASVLDDESLTQELKKLAVTDPDADSTEVISKWLQGRNEPQLKNVANKINAQAKNPNQPAQPAQPAQPVKAAKSLAPQKPIPPQQPMAEELDADQKRVGQLGPTGGHAKPGHLVGEGQEDLDAIRRIIRK